jgi:trehalose 6-phosphate phosphatase
MSRNLFDALEEIGQRVRGASHVLLGLDFDGTLAPTVEDPAQAELPPATRDALWLLSSNDRVTQAILSGRNRADLQDRVAIPQLIYAGNHGLEISGPGWLFVEPTAAAHSPALKEVGTDLQEKLRQIPGVVVEDKGLTLAVHYRSVSAENSEEVKRIVHSALAGTSHPFVLSAGDKVYEIRPRVYWNKGTATSCIKVQIGQLDALVIYMGDDVSDEEAFAAIGEGITIKVGNPSGTAASFHVDGPEDVCRFLNWLDAQLRPKNPGAPVIGRAAPTKIPHIINS